MRKGINISHVNIENMGGRDQSQVKNKVLKSSKKVRLSNENIPKSHNNDILHHKVSMSMAGGVLSVLTNAGLDKGVSSRSSRWIVAEVGVGNKLRIADKVRKSKGE